MKNLDKTTKILGGFIIVMAVIFIAIILVAKPSYKKWSQNKEIIYVEKIGYIKEFNYYNINGRTITIHFDYGIREYTNYKCRIFQSDDFKSLGFPMSNDDIQVMFIDGTILHGKYDIIECNSNILSLMCDGKKYTFLNYGNDIRIRTSALPQIEIEG